MSFEVLEDKRVNIIIVGSGKVGYTLAQHLNAEGHEITVIDSDEEKIKDLSSEMDIYCVLGNGTSYRTQKEAGIEKADLLISVANQDEVNLLSCLIAKKAGNCQTIARVRNPEYYEEILSICNDKSVKVILDVSSPKLKELLRFRPYLIKPNDEEIAEIFGIVMKSEPDIVDALGYLHEKGAQNILLTLGEKGAYFSKGKDIYYVEAYPVKLLSSACAGDSSLAAFLSIWLENTKSIETALKRCAAVGANVAESNGIGDLAQVDNYMGKINVRRVNDK